MHREKAIILGRFSSIGLFKLQNYTFIYHLSACLSPSLYIIYEHIMCVWFVCVWRVCGLCVCGLCVCIPIPCICDWSGFSERLVLYFTFVFKAASQFSVLWLQLPVPSLITHSLNKGRCHTAHMQMEGGRFLFWFFVFFLKSNSLSVKYYVEVVCNV